MQALLCRLVQVIKCLNVNDLLNAKLLNFFIGVELECYSSEAILHWVLIKSVGHERVCLSESYIRCRVYFLFMIIKECLN